MYKQELKIPKERIAILVGTKGEVKKLIEKKANVSLEIDSAEGDVLIKGEESLNLYVVTDVVKAIGRGFSPKVAINLLDDRYMLDIIDVTDYTGKSQKDKIRLRGRVIGREGKSRTMIENITNTKISVYGKTVGVLGEVENVAMARKAVDMLLSGAPHGNVYRWLENKKREIEKRVFEKEHGIN